MDPAHKCVKLFEWYSLCVTCMSFFHHTIHAMKQPCLLVVDGVYPGLYSSDPKAHLLLPRHAFLHLMHPFHPCVSPDAMPRTAVHRFPRHVQWCTCFVQCLIQYIQDVVPVFLLGSMDYNSRSGDTSFTYTIWYVKCIRFAFVICHWEIDSGTAECKFESDIMSNLIYKSQPDEFW